MKLVLLLGLCTPIIANAGMYVDAGALELKCNQQWSLAPPAVLYQINQCTLGKDIPTQLKDCEDLYIMASISTNCINWRKKWVNF